MIQCRKNACTTPAAAQRESSRLHDAGWIALCLILFPAWAAGAGGALTLGESERLALETDLTAPRFEALAGARKEQAVAAGQLPDPKLKLGAVNLPIDSFDRKQENMTQMQVGLQQSFPPGRTLGLRSEQAEIMATADEARARAMTREVLRDVRERYLDVYYQVEAGGIIDNSRELFDQLLEVTRFYYSQGRKNQQDVLRASVELALLDDRRTRVRTEEDKMRADLARLIGSQAAYQTLSTTFPVLDKLPSRAEMDNAVLAHPSLRAEDIVVEAGHVGVDIARQSYKPGWMLDVTYGNRAGRNNDGSSRDDFLSAMVIMDIPLFADKRQDRVLATRQQEVEAARLQRDDRYLRLKQKLDADYAEWLRLGERLELYQSTIFPEAVQNAEASLTAYQSGVTDFTGVMRARITELDVRLQNLRIRVDQAKAEARLFYIATKSR